MPSGPYESLLQTSVRFASTPAHSTGVSTSSEQITSRHHLVDADRIPPIIPWTRESERHLGAAEPPTSSAPVAPLQARRGRRRSVVGRLRPAGSRRKGKVP